MILNIAEHIYSTLVNDERVSALVGDKVFPIATQTETTFPFIVFERDAVSPRYDKEGISSVTINSVVYICSEQYTESISIAEAVSEALDRVKAEYDTFKVEDAIITGAFESYVNNTFVQQINLTFITKK